MSCTCKLIVPHSPQITLLHFNFLSTLSPSSTRLLSFYTFTFVLHFHFLSTLSLPVYTFCVHFNFSMSTFALFLRFDFFPHIYFLSTLSLSFFHFLSTLSLYFHTFFIHFHFLCTTVHFPIGQFAPRSCVHWQFFISLDFPFSAWNKNCRISGHQCNYCHGI